jgi:thiamine-monophosphate kinase
MKVKDIGEIALVERLARRIRLDPSVLLGIGDDAAVIQWTKEAHMLFACDMLLEGVHFTLAHATPFQIGWKALAVNISDIAAMGGVPKYAVVSIGIDPGRQVSFVDGIYRGLRSLARKFSVSIVGGDTNRSRKLVIDVALIGTVEKERLTRRSGARAGDVILVTGALGGSIKGRHLTFLPRLREARALVQDFRVSSMIDVSDGLVLDLWRILRASSCGGRIYETCVPVSRDADSFGAAITDGEDFELLFTMEPREARRFFREALAGFGTDVHLIGQVLGEKEGLTLVTGDGSMKALKPEGYAHF